jgi:hypothetical protein
MTAVDQQWKNPLEIGVHEGVFFIPLEGVTPDEKSTCPIARNSHYFANPL